MSTTKAIVRGVVSVAVAALTVGALMAGDLWVAGLLAIVAFVAWPRRSTQHTRGATP